MSGYSGKDARRDTNSSRKQQRQSWHDARDHAAGSGQLRERNKNKIKDSHSGTILDELFELAGLKGSNSNKKRK